MNIENILLMIITGVTFILSVYIYKKNRKDEVNISFSLLTFCGAIWAFNIAMFRMSTGIESALFWDRMIYIFGTIFGSSFLYFSEVFPFRKKILPTIQKLLIFSPFIIFFFFLFFTNLFIKGINITSQGNEVDLGLAYTAWMLYFFIFMGWSFINLILKYRKSTGISKSQIRYVLLALLFPAMASMPFNLILPYFGNYGLIWVGPFCVGAMFVIIAYAIIYHRFMDIRVVLGQSAVYFLSFATVLVSAFFLMVLNNRLVKPLSFNLAGTIIIVLSIILFQLIFRFFEKVASKYFYYTFYSYQTVLTNLTKQLTQVLDLDKLSSLVVSTLIDIMKLDRVVVLLRNPKTGDYQIQKNIGFKEENGISLVRDNFLTFYLEKTKKPVVYEELSLFIRDAEEEEEKEKLDRLRNNMKRIEATVCLPLFIEDKITGMIVLGNKVSGEPYSKQDLDLFLNLSNQASIAFQNARLYTQVQDLSQNLQRKVREQTKDIQALSEMKSKFLKVVNHQLRTPVSIIKGMASMLSEGGLSKQKQKDFIQRLYISSERLSTILDDILVAQSLVGEGEKLKLAPCQIEKIVGEEIEHLKPQAKDRGLEVLFKMPKENLPIILADSEMIKRAVSRLLDNAILYTPSAGSGQAEKGKIQISLALKKGEDKNLIQISIKDTGIGLDKEDQKNLFKLFFRGEKATHLHTNGSGLGLFIVKNLIEAHQGKIEAKSEGRSKGTEFIITLPVITEI